MSRIFPAGDTAGRFPKVLISSVVALLAAFHHEAVAVTANSPVTGGDVFIINSNLNSFSQIENGIRAGGAVTYGATDQLGGIFSDASGIYFAGNPGGTGLTV